MYGSQLVLDIRYILNHPEVYYIPKFHVQVPAKVSDRNAQNLPTPLLMPSFMNTIQILTLPPY